MPKNVNKDARPRNYDQALDWWRNVKNFLTDQEGKPLSMIQELETLLEQQSQRPGGIDLANHLTGLSISEDLKQTLAEGLLEVAQETLKDQIMGLYYQLNKAFGNTMLKEYPTSILMDGAFDADEAYIENGFIMRKDDNNNTYWRVRKYTPIYDPASDTPVHFEHENPLPCLLWMLDHDADDFS